MLEQILDFNRRFVDGKQYEQYVTDKFPNKKIAILSCMDARLTELLPASLGLKNGDVKLVKNAGAVITSPFGSVMRSLIIAVYNLEVEEILVIGHSDCGMQSLDSAAIFEKMQARGVTQQQMDLIAYCGFDLKSWLSGFDSAEDSVRATVKAITGHPLIPKDVAVYGLIMDPTTGGIGRVDTK